MPRVSSLQHTQYSRVDLLLHENSINKICYYILKNLNWIVLWKAFLFRIFEFPIRERYTKWFFLYYQMGSKEAYDPRRGDASRVADFVVVFACELLLVGDSLVDGEYEREYDDNERRDAAGIRAHSADGERDCERAATMGADDGGPAVHDVPAVQGSQVRTEGLHGHRRHRQRRWPDGEEQAERQREQSRPGEQHADSDVEARVDWRHRCEPRPESRRLRHVPAADIVKSGLRQPLLNALLAYRRDKQARS